MDIFTSIFEYVSDCLWNTHTIYMKYSRMYIFVFTFHFSIATQRRIVFAAYVFSIEMWIFVLLLLITNLIILQLKLHYLLAIGARETIIRVFRWLN